MRTGITFSSHTSLNIISILKKRFAYAKLNVSVYELVCTCFCVYTCVYTACDHAPLLDMRIIVCIQTMGLG